MVTAPVESADIPTPSVWSRDSASRLPGHLSAMYPFESRWHVTAGGHRMHYIDEGWADGTGDGAGPADPVPVVCVHGNPSWSFLFRDVVAALRPTRRVIAMDHIGCGLSDKPGDAAYGYRLANRVDDLDGLIDTLVGPDTPVDLVLHDWGGMIGSAWAMRHRGRVRRLVAMNTAAFGLPPGRRLPVTLKLLKAAGPLAELMVRGGNAFAGLAAHGWATARPMPPDVRDGFLFPYRTWADRIATLRFVQDIPLGPEDVSYATVKAVDDAVAAGLYAGVPTFLLWGLRDFVFDAAFLAEWHRRLPHARVSAHEGAGHYVLEDLGARGVAEVAAHLTASAAGTVGAAAP